MRVALVGASGLIGRRLETVLRSRGDHVVTITRTPLEALAGRTPVGWDGSTALPADALHGCDAVVNLAGAPVAQRWTDSVKRELVTSRVDLTERLVDAIGTDGPRTLVNGSAVGYYGATEDPVDENSPHGAGFLADLCVRWEAAARRGEDQGVRVALLRSGIVLSTRGGALKPMLPTARLGLAGPIAGGRQWFPWIHIDDELALIVRAIDDGEVVGPVNGVAPGIVRQGAFARALGRSLHRRAFMPVPRVVLRLLFGEGADAVMEGQHAIPRAAQRLDQPFAFPDVESALADLLSRGV